MNNVYSITAKQLAALGQDNIPAELQSSAHMIYSSPATLAFNSPGAQGFGVKRAGLSIPGSVMLLAAPACCGRNTTLAGGKEGDSDKFFYMLMDETDIVTGRHLSKIPEAVKEVCEACEQPPSVVMICITCVDALLGTDMERVCRKASAFVGIPVLPCYMYALTREGRLPPMAAVRKSIYSLLEPTPKKPTSVNLLGYFSPIDDECELYTMLKKAGVTQIREISRCENFNEYMKMSEANFNLILNQEARYAAQDMADRLEIPGIELNRMYQIDKIQTQYKLFGEAAGIKFDDQKYYDEALSAIEECYKKHSNRIFAVGEWVNADPFELSLALIRYGFSVSDIYGTAGEINFAYIKKISDISPETRIYSNLSPTMLYHSAENSDADAFIGQDAAYYHSECPGIYWNEERQPFGYSGVKRLFTSLNTALSGGIINE
ncbi:MAG: nitrogenase component 1 [Spirochaetales bacterium]|nr:nitrogenase component 1 [Spirochaetales bacterium]